MFRRCNVGLRVCVADRVIVLSCVALLEIGPGVGCSDVGV